MSTKVYNGFKFKSSDMIDIHTAIMDFRMELEALHLRALAELYAKLAVQMIDKAAMVPGKHAGESPLVKAWENVITRQKEIKKTGGRDPDVDFDFSLSILPFRGEVYGIVYTEKSAWRDLWLEKDFVEDFSYWNNSDRPEGLSKDDWKHRSDVWHDMFGTGIFTVPAMCGFNADCTRESLHPSSEDVLAAVPSFEDRVLYHAINEVAGAEFGRRKAAMERDTPEEEQKFIPSHYFGMVTDARRWLTTEDGKLAVEAEVSRLRTILPPEITREILIGHLPELPKDQTAEPELRLEAPRPALESGSP